MQVTGEREITAYATRVKARHLWLDWFERSDNYPYYSHLGSYEWCFFCETPKESDHDEKCVYVRACKEFAKECK